MTNVYRRYNPQTRRLLPLDESGYGGVVSDNYGLTIHIEYTDEDYLTNRTPIIIFNVLNEFGETYTFSPNSIPAFDGHTFTVPYQVMQGIKDNYLKYQLAFLSAQSGTESGDSVELSQSQIDSIYWGDALLIYDNLPSEITEEPSVRMWIEWFKANAVVLNVDYDNDRTLTVTTQNGTEQSIELNVPTLNDNGYVDDSYLDSGIEPGQIVKVGEDGYIDGNIIPAYSINNFLGTVSQKSQLTGFTDANKGDWATVTNDPTSNNNGPYLLDGDYSDINDWIRMNWLDGTALWGSISGSLSNQTDLKNALDGKVSDVKVNGTTVVNSSGVANIPIANSSYLGAVKLGFTASATRDRSYPVKSGSGGVVYVNIPWQKVKAGQGLAITGTSHGVDGNSGDSYNDGITLGARVYSNTSQGTIGTTPNLYPVGFDSDDRLCVLIDDLTGKYITVAIDDGLGWSESEVSQQWYKIQASGTVVSTNDSENQYYELSPTNTYGVKILQAGVYRIRTSLRMTDVSNNGWSIGIYQNDTLLIESADWEVGKHGNTVEITVSADENDIFKVGLYGGGGASTVGSGTGVIPVTTNNVTMIEVVKVG